MNRNFTLSRVAPLSLVLALVFTCSQAFGQSMMTAPQVDTYTNVNDSITGDGTGGYTLTFNQFNSSLGTLTGVQITMSGIDVTGTVSVMNNSSLTRTYTNVTLVGNYQVSDSVGNAVNVSISSPSFTSTPTAPGGTYTTPTTSNATPGSATQTLTSAGSLAIYEGTGSSTINLSLSSSNTGSATGSGNVAFSEASMGSGNVQIIYIYTPVPEPAQTAAWMLCFALCFMGGRKYLQSRELVSI